MTTKVDEFDEESVLILYPHDEAVEVKKLSKEEILSAKKVVGVDCTWNQTTGILNKLKGKKYKYVKISDRDTTFWRHKKESSKCLSTCEAIYYFFVEYDEQYEKVVNGNDEYKYYGKYDNILFYYMLQYSSIERDYLKVGKEE